MSNRQERRAAKAMARKAAKGKGGLSHRILRQAAAWLDEEAVDLEDIGIDDPRFDSTLVEQADDLMELLGDRFFDFMGDLNDQAMRSYRSGATSDGKELLAVSQMFFIPVHGPEHSVNNVVGDVDDFNWLVKSLRGSGVAHDASNVRLLRGFLGPEAAASLMPGALSKAAAALARSTFPGSGNIDTTDDEAILALLGGDAITGRLDPMRHITVVERIVVGVRTMLVDPELDHDDRQIDYLSYFMPPDRVLLLDEGPDDYDDVEEDGFHDDSMGALASWHDAVNERFSDQGVIVDFPEAWPKAIGAMARNRLLGALGIEKAMLGIDHDARADKAHVHYGEGALLVALEYGDHLIGPIDVPLPLVLPDQEGFTDVLVDLAQGIDMHQDIGSLLALRGGAVRPGSMH